MKKIVLLNKALENDILTEEQRSSLKRILNDQQLEVINYNYNYFKIKNLENLVKNNMIDVIILHPILKKSQELSWLFNNNPTVKFLFPCLNYTAIKRGPKLIKFIKIADKPVDAWCGWEVTKRFMYVDIYASELYM